MSEPAPYKVDSHSHARPEEAVVTHLTLALTVDFESKVLHGSVKLRFRRQAPTDTLWLDSKGLVIERVLLDSGEETSWLLLPEQEDRHLGSGLGIRLQAQTQSVTVYYRTAAAAPALQWLAPEQTHSKKHPFLFTQSQAILARTWIPLQDSPGIRFTYQASIQCPPALLALMSAENPQQKNPAGIYHFRMPYPIPAYLMALCIGDLEFRALSEISGIYAEPGQIAQAAWEFAEIPAMIRAAEKLFGPYRWGRFDVLVAPPSFPFGGMENPRLTLATPTILAGDRSLVSIVAHELAHSWTGNLVTNATWNDFWLNEGFTEYAQQRIIEEIHGKQYAAMLDALALADLEMEVEKLGADSPDTHLLLDLDGRNPDDGITNIAYQKGRLFLCLLESVVGRARMDSFLSDYISDYAFRNISTEDFLVYLNEKLLAETPDWPARVQAQRWVFGPGIPENCPRVAANPFLAIDEAIERFDRGEPCAALWMDTRDFAPLHWIYFLRNIKQQVAPDRLQELGRFAGLAHTSNQELACQWLILCIKNAHWELAPNLERFLIEVGRRKYVKALFEELLAAPGGRERAQQIYRKARPGYHAVTRSTIDELMARSQPRAATPPQMSSALP